MSPSVSPGARLGRSEIVAIPDQLPIYDTLTIDDPEWVDESLTYEGIEEQIRQRFGGIIGHFLSAIAPRKRRSLSNFNPS